MKKVFFKIFNSSGELIVENWTDANFVGFTKRINGGLGLCKIELGREFDDFGEFDDIKLGNEVQVWVHDDDSEDDFGTLIYSGYISSYEPTLENGQEKVIVNLLGYYTLLEQDIYKNGATLTITETTEDVGVIFRNIMTRYRAETTNPKIHFSLDSVQETGNDGSYEFNIMTYRDAIEKAREMAPEGWYWYVNQYNEIKFQEKASSPDHLFILGRHFHKIKVVKSVEKIKNIAIVRDRSAIEEIREDDLSIADYSRRVQKYSDSKIGDVATAQAIGDSIINTYKDPEIKVVAEIIDNYSGKGYDIESINPGDTCYFEGFEHLLSNTFKYNSLITEVEYTLDKAIITIEPLRAGIIDTQKRMQKEIEKISTDI